MGIKSRGNYCIKICMKFDYKNRNKKCKECVRFNKYEKQNKKS